MALIAAVVAFAPVTALTWRLDSRAWPFIAIGLLGKLLGHPVTIDFTNDAYWPFFTLMALISAGA